MSTINLSHPMISVLTLLGGEGVLNAKPRVVMDWIPLVRRGLPVASVDSIVRLTRIAQTEMAQALAIPERTLARRKREGVLSPEESAKFVRFARVWSALKRSLRTGRLRWHGSSWSTLHWAVSRRCR